MATLLLKISYQRPNINTYEGVTIDSFHLSKRFYSGDVVIDFAEAYQFCWSYPDCTEITFHDSCDLFVLDSGGRYAFNSDAFLVMDSHYAHME